jgi:acetoin utilization deacetylase AcuC-like enzyme
MAARIRKIAECCDGRIVLALEGGYDFAALKESVGCVLQALALETAPIPENPVEASRYLLKVLDRVVAANHFRWNFS